MVPNTRPLLATITLVASLAGGRLLSAQAADADEVPAYLYTGNPDNLPYYRSHGYEVLSEAMTVRGAPSWFMQREPAGSSRP